MARSKSKLILIVREFRNKKTGRVETYSVQHLPSLSAARRQLRRDAGQKGAGKVSSLVENALIELKKYGQFWIHTTASSRSVEIQTAGSAQRTFRKRLGGHYK